MDWVNASQKRKLPPIFPILLYNGDARWSAAVEIVNLIEREPDLGDGSFITWLFNCRPQILTLNTLPW